MKKSLKTIVLIIISIALLIGAGYLAYKQEPVRQFVQNNILGQKQPQQPELDDSNAQPQNTAETAKANNKFAFDLYTLYQNKHSGENIFFSPYSISTALAMTYEGAQGQTAKEIAEVFYLPKDAETRHASFADIHNSLNPDNTKYQLNTANAIWPQQDFPIKENYLNTIKNYYDGKAENVDYRNNPEQARQKINSWVEEQTQNKIKDLFPQGSLTKDTRLTLTNAIYFKGTWLNQFKKRNTQKTDFYMENGETTTVDMMQITNSDLTFNFYEGEDFKALELPYDGEKLSMYVFLPDKGKTAEFEAAMTPDSIKKHQNAMAKREVDIYLPKFKLETKYKMAQDLAELGMPTPFDRQKADFTGISSQRGKDLFIEKVIHQAYVEVNEKGTEAAAATGVSVGIASVKPQKPTFRADHPFIFFIEEKETGQILFMGKVEDLG